MRVSAPIRLPPALLGPLEERRIDAVGLARPEHDRLQAERLEVDEQARHAAARSPRAARAPRGGSAGPARRAPLRGSAIGTPTPPTAGKLCSQIGSWITTGTSSQPWPIASSQASAGDAAEKVGEHEDEAAGRQFAAAARRGTRARARARPRARRKAVSPPSRSAISQRPVAPAGRQPPRLAAAEVERGRCPRARRPHWRRSPPPPRAARRASRATAAARGRGPSRVGGRRRPRRAAPRRRRARGRRTRRAARGRRGAPVRASRSSRPGRPARTGAMPDRRRCRGRGGGSASSPNGSPVSRRRGTSGNVRRSRTTRRSRGVPVRAPAAAPAPGSGRGSRSSASSRPSARVSARIGGGEQQPVAEHRQEQPLDVLGHDVAAARAGAPTRAPCARA